MFPLLFKVGVEGVVGEIVNATTPSSIFPFIRGRDIAIKQR
jgi:hypothetical protein